MSTKYKRDKAKITEARHKHGMNNTIMLGPYGRIRPSTIIAVAKRWKERIGHSVRSSGRPNKNYNYSGREVAQRLAVRELMTPLKKLNLPKPAWFAIESILQHRTQKVKNSDILVRQNREVLLIKLLNSLGEEKTMHALDLISKRSQDIQKAANSEKISSKSDSDAFSNIGPNVTAIHQMLEMDLYDKPDFVKRIQDILHQKSKQLNEIENIKDKRRRAKLNKIVFEQLTEGTLELTKYKIHHNIF